MATGGEDKVAYSLVKDRTLTLENDAKQPDYVSVVVCQDKIIVLDYIKWRIKIHRLHDGKLLATSDRMESVPRSMCLIDPMTICVIHYDGLIKMMSIDSTDMLCVIKTTMNLHRQGVLDEYYGVVRFKDYLVVTGVKQHTMYWCIVTLDDQNIYTIQKICKGHEWSFVTTKGNSIYIACCDGDESPHNGVYEFNILNPSQCKHTYKHQRLPLPRSIVANEDGNIFVCNEVPDSCIHQLTASCQLVAIFTCDIPWRPFAIFWDNGHLYVPCYKSNDITVFRHEYQVGSHISPEVLESDERRHPVIKETAIQIEERNKKDPNEQIYSLALDLTASQKPQLCLPSGKRYHAFFSYANPDMQWVKDTVEKLEKEHGFVCCEYDRDNTPGTPLMLFAENSIKYAYRTVVVMTCEAFESDFVKHEIDMAFIQGFDEKRKCIVPVLLKDCNVPVRLRALNYIDARDPFQRDNWWPTLLTELQPQDKSSEVLESNQMEQGDVDQRQSSVATEMPPSGPVHADSEDDKQGRKQAALKPTVEGGQKAPEVLGSDGKKQLFTSDTCAKIEQGNQTNYPAEQTYYRISDLTAPEKSKLFLPPGKKYHVFFSYASPDIHWVKETVERLENDHGFVCCEYDRDNATGTGVLPFAADSIKFAIKTVVVMTKEAFKGGFVEHEIQMALQQGFETGRKCVVPILVQDCTIPDYLQIVNYVDARDPSQRDIWWPKLLTELQTQAGNDNDPEVIGSDQRNQHLSEETFTQLEQGDNKKEQQQLYITTESGTWV